MSLLPPRVDTKAICDPSGDQVGYSLFPGIDVIRVRLEPSGFTAQTSNLYSRRELKAILSPLGDHAGES